jgi:hypothetical protein
MEISVPVYLVGEKKDMRSGFDELQDEDWDRFRPPGMGIRQKSGHVM